MHRIGRTTAVMAALILPMLLAACTSNGDFASTRPSGHRLSPTVTHRQTMPKPCHQQANDTGPGSYTGFARGLVSVTFDDGYASQFFNALPVLRRYCIPGTFYIISGALTQQPAYMTGDQVQALSASGQEIASHTVSHAHLKTLTTDELKNELAQSQETLQALIGKAVPDFAYPYGEYSSDTIEAASSIYQSQRTVDAGYNTKSNFQPTKLLVQNVVHSTTTSDVRGWITKAAHDKSWLILVYHEVANNPVFHAEMAMVKNSGLGLVTISQAVAEILPQLR
jgi:peptidoglycan/xylan/chitin deacetylase (PgdA/CDA1 family)